MITDTPHFDTNHPMKGERWLSVDGKVPGKDDPVIVGSSTYRAGERIAVAWENCVAGIPPVGGNIYTGTAKIRIEVKNMPPVLAARILSLVDSAVAVLEGNLSPETFAEGWRHIDEKARGESAAKSAN